MVGEKALLVSHLSFFRYIDVEESMGTQFQALFVVDNAVKNNGSSISSLRDAPHIIHNGSVSGWGQLIELPENKFRIGLVFSPNSSKGARSYDVTCPIQDVFRSGGYIHESTS